MVRPKFFKRSRSSPRLLMPWLLVLSSINTLRPRQDGRHFSVDIYTCIFFNESCCILIKFSLKYARKDPIDNNPALVQIMAWHRSGNKPLSEPTMISLPTHICVTRPQWVKEPWYWLWYHGINSSPPGTTCMHWWTGSALIQVMACHLCCAKPLPEPMLTYCQLAP